MKALIATHHERIGGIQSLRNVVFFKKIDEKW